MDNLQKIESDAAWIACSDKQPTRSGTFALVTVRRGKRKPFVTFASYWINGGNQHAPTGWASMDDEELDGVVAWMPLPKPYAHNAQVQASGAPTINEGESGCSASPATEG